MSHEQKPRTVPWIERIAHWVPGYGGYLERGNRRAADQALREVVANRLTSVKTSLEAVVRKLVDAGDLTRLSSLDRLVRHVESLSGRIQAAGAGTSDFYGSSSVDHSKADSLHAFDFDLLERVEALGRHVEQPDHDGDFLPRLEAQLRELDQRLDERTRILQGIR